MVILPCSLSRRCLICQLLSKALLNARPLPTTRPPKALSTWFCHVHSPNSIIPCPLLAMQVGKAQRHPLFDCQPECLGFSRFLQLLLSLVFSLSLCYNSSISCANHSRGGLRQAARDFSSALLFCSDLAAGLSSLLITNASWDSIMPTAPPDVRRRSRSGKDSPTLGFLSSSKRMP